MQSLSRGTSWVSSRQSMAMTQHAATGTSPQWRSMRQHLRHSRGGGSGMVGQGRQGRAVRYGIYGLLNFKAGWVAGCSHLGLQAALAPPS